MKIHFLFTYILLYSISAHVKNHNADYAVRGVTSTSLLDMRGLTIMKTYDRWIWVGLSVS